ncbi:MAG TPA: pyridoxal phosphate-dependent aminotransferase [Acidobacteriaceae bacterium]|nr:pyridoxal phosphate-dependent aminotransferase [Acidobacteriaceae bacterium]
MPHRFSTRTQWESAKDAYTLAVREARASKRELIDLTASNPTTCGFAFDAEKVLAPLSDPAALVYDPDPRGMRSAREAVAQYYADHGAAVDPDEILLTTSTSEAYSFLFRLLCDPGDEVLIPQPSYPLFDLLAGLENIVLKPYPLFYDPGGGDHSWSIDVATLERSITPRTRALLLVHPNNPTGHYTSANERKEVEAICARHNLALIVDEVFLDYPKEAPISAAAKAEAMSFTAGNPPVLTFVLSGMSKIAALPQMKVSWLVCRGAEEVKVAALARLEVIADTFLSVNAPVQLALPAWLHAREPVQQQILTRVRQNFAAVQAAGLEYLEWQAGWSLVLRVPAGEADLSLAARLVREAGVLVHPGSFYGMAPTGRLVVSLLSEPQVFTEGIERLSAAIKG